MNVISRPAASLTTEHFDTETLALLDELDVEIPEFGGVDLDVAFGTPLEMHEPFATACEKGLASQDLMEQFFARRQAALDIVADDPGITTRVRERLVDVLLPYAAQLRIAPPAAAPLPIAA
ncbi:hypothetical protein ACH4PW_31595 [Streptomyces sp. NPDC017082]|uniref:hypothetical protein n=1 Tax=Streptomyces sp. NPDC017082 TaxID=3364974 RepID=UPI0037AE0C65